MQSCPIVKSRKNLSTRNNIYCVGSIDGGRDGGITICNCRDSLDFFGINFSSRASWCLVWEERGDLPCTRECGAWWSRDRQSVPGAGSSSEQRNFPDWLTRVDGLLVNLSGPELQYIQHSHWSSSYIAALSLVENSGGLKNFHALKGPIIADFSVTTPAVLCVMP